MPATPQYPQLPAPPALFRTSVAALAAYVSAALLALQHNWTTLTYTLNATHKNDTIANRTATPILNESFFTATDTGLTYLGIAGAWQLRGQAGTVTTITATATAGAEDSVILADATAGAITVNLPASANRSGRIYHVKKTDASANAVTVDPAGAETIDGAATRALSTQWASVTAVSNGSNWFTL